MPRQSRGLSAIERYQQYTTTAKGTIQLLELGTKWSFFVLSRLLRLDAKQQRPVRIILRSVWSYTFLSITAKMTRHCFLLHFVQAHWGIFTLANDESFADRIFYNRVSLHDNGWCRRDKSGMINTCAVSIIQSDWVRVTQSPMFNTWYHSMQIQSRRDVESTSDSTFQVVSAFVYPVPYRLLYHFVSLLRQSHGHNEYI